MEQQPADAMETEVGHVDPRRARENSSPFTDVQRAFEHGNLVLRKRALIQQARMCACGASKCVSKVGLVFP